MGSGGGSLDQINTKYIINEAEDIIKDIKSLEADDKEHEASDIDIICPDLKSLQFSSTPCHDMYEDLQPDSYRDIVRRKLQIPETPIRNSRETGHSNLFMTISETPSNRQVDTRNTSTSMSPRNLSVCTRRIVRREKNPDTFDGRSNDWKVYLTHFEQTAAWNKWTEQEKAQQLSMSLRGIY